MSKERLEEIKMLWEQNNDVCFPDDYEWLIEQAERVQELKEWQKKAQQLHESLKRQDEVLDRLRQQNERYREALEYIGNHANESELMDNTMYTELVKEIIEKALEGEE